MNIFSKENDVNDNVELPQWQKEALDAELKRLKENPDSFIDWEELKKRYLP